MTLTKDQKTALYIGGGVAVIALLYYLTSRTTFPVPAGTEVPAVPIYDNSTPGYTTFNIQPPFAAPVVPFGFNDASGRCCGDRDGCFTNNNTQTDVGRGPISLDQLLLLFGNEHPTFAQSYQSMFSAYRGSGA